VANVAATQFHSRKRLRRIGAVNGSRGQIAKNLRCRISMTRGQNKYAHKGIKHPSQITLKRLKSMDLDQMQTVLSRCKRWEPSPDVAAAEALILEEIDRLQAWQEMQKLRES
jgi:transposase